MRTTSLSSCARRRVRKCAGVAVAVDGDVAAVEGRGTSIVPFHTPGVRQRLSTRTRHISFLLKETVLADRVALSPPLSRIWTVPRHATNCTVPVIDAQRQHPII